MKTNIFIIFALTLAFAASEVHATALPDGHSQRSINILNI